jgi:hypothetical protein
MSPGTKKVEKGELASNDFGIERPSADTIPMPPPTADTLCKTATTTRLPYATPRGGVPGHEEAAPAERLMVEGGGWHLCSSGIGTSRISRP